MNYETLLEELFALPTTPAFDPSRYRSELLEKALKYPSSHYPIVHVAGSNGKGSVVTKMGKVLTLSGYKVGIYTSPHLYCYRERIRIGEEKISEEEVIAGILRLQEIAKAIGITPTCFEITTFLAFEHFKKHKVDIAIIEVGLGGKFDATNGVTPLVSVITSISKEHTSILGKTTEEIAMQKGGIIKPGIPVVLGKTAQMPTLFAIAKNQNSKTYCVTKEFPFFDEENQEIARLALEHIAPAFPYTKEALSQGLQTRPECRFEIIDSCIFDVAHNPAAITSLLQALFLFFPLRKLRFLVAFSNDKNYPLCLSMISQVASHIHLTPYPSERTTPTALLSQALCKQGFSMHTEHTCVKEGFSQALQYAKENNELLIICGSFYMMKEAAAGKAL